MKKPLTFEARIASLIRIQTVGAVLNDLSVRVDTVRIYDPRQNRNDVTSMEITDSVKEGQTVYVEAFKGFGTDYRTVPWNAGVTLGDRVVPIVGGWDVGSMAGADGYYPMGSFVPPVDIVADLPDNLELGVPVKLLLQFVSGAERVHLWVPMEPAKTQTVTHELKDRVKGVFLLSVDEHEGGDRL